MAGKQADLKQTIKDSIDYLKKYFRIKEVILFGSQMEGRADEFSDIDLVVISPDFSGRSYEEILNTFAELTLRCGSNIELHPYTDEDLKNARPTNFLGFVLKTGKVVFRNDKFEM
jgi:predicted nucleotidyltransferase